MKSWPPAVALLLLYILAGCGPAPSTVPAAPTATPARPALPTATPAATPRPTLTPAPTTAPYDRVPELADDGWPVASLTAVGIDPVRIGRMLESIYHGDNSGDTLRMPGGGRKYENVHGILIVKDGHLVFEEYFYDYQRNMTHNVASVTKSVTSLLVGLAIAQGYLDGVQEEVLPYVPEYLPLRQPDERKADITVEDLLTMRHGLDCDDWDPASVTYYKKGFEFEQPNLVEATLNLPLETSPGAHYSYCSASTVVLGAVLRRATGMDIPDLAEQNLFGPLGIGSAVWTAVPGKWTDTGGGMQLLPRDMARLGLLMLQDGSWNGEQIVPEEWVRQSIAPHVSLEFNPAWGNGYGYLWWLSDVQIAGTKVHSFAASGFGGQVIAVFPRLKMVVVFTGGDYEDDAGLPFTIMEEFILPAVLGY